MGWLPQRAPHPQLAQVFGFWRRGPCRSTEPAPASDPLSLPVCGKRPHGQALTVLL